MDADTTPCECGKRMILVYTGQVYATHPEQYGRDWACFGCGARKAAPNKVAQTQADLDRQRWERANQPK